MSTLDIGWEPERETWPAPREPERLNPRAVLRRWLAIVALLAAVGTVGWLEFQRFENHLAGEQALAAAEAYVLRLTNIDAAEIDRNFADIADGATGEFQGMHSRSGAKLRQVLIDSGASARGHVADSVIKSAERTHAVVVLLVNQSVRNVDNPQPVLDRSRIRMTMDKVDGRWLTSKVELV